MSTEHRARSGEQGSGSAERRAHVDAWLRAALSSSANTQGAGSGEQFQPARPSFACGSIGLSADGIEGIEEGPRRSLFARRNRFRPGFLGNLLVRAGQLRRVA